MIRVFYTQKNKQLIKKSDLSQCHNHLQEKINHDHQELSDNWKMWF